MASKLYRGRDGKKKYKWEQTKLEFQLTASANGSPYADSFYFDVARAASAMNHKLIRQGNLFRIKNLRVYQADDVDQRRFKVGVIPTTWFVRNAWVKAKALWDEHNALAVKDVGGKTIHGKYSDFKIFMNAEHKAHVDEATSATPTIQANPNLIPQPCDLDGNEIWQYISSHWDYSQFATSGSTSDEFFVKMLGQNEGSNLETSSANYSTVGLLEAYRQSRTIQHFEDPTTPGDMVYSPWQMLFGDDDQTKETLLHIMFDNDGPPYNPSQFVGEGNDNGGFGIATAATTNMGTAAINPAPVSFDAPCGLFRLEIDDNSNMSGETIHVSFEYEVLCPMDA